MRLFPAQSTKVLNIARVLLVNLRFEDLRKPNVEHEALASTVQRSPVMFRNCEIQEHNNIRIDSFLLSTVL
jgi:hypothetical protein